MNEVLMLGSILLGCAHGRMSTACKRDEDTARQGCHDMVSLLNQMVGASAFIDILSHFSKKTTLHNPLLDYSINPIYLISPVVYGLDYLGKKGYTIPPIVKNSAVWLKNNISSVYQVANVVTNIALLYLGHRAYAITSLSILAYGYLDRRNCVNQTIRQIYERVIPWLSVIGAIQSESSLFKGIIVLDAIDKIAAWATAPRSIPFDQVPNPHHLTFKDFEAIHGNTTFTVVREHVEIQPFPTVEGDLVTPFLQWIEDKNNFDWEEASVYESLCIGLNDDARWQQSEEFKQITELTTEDEIKKIKNDYAKRTFNTLITSVRDEKIQTGQPLHYGILKNYLNFIAKEMPRIPKKQLSKLIVQMSVNGGEYCGQGVYNQLETVCTEIINANTSGEVLPLKQRILLLLQQERLTIISAYLLLLESKHPPLMAMHGGSEAIHGFNFAVNLLGDHFGLPDQGAKSDKLTKLARWEKVVFRTLLGISTENLWNKASLEKTVWKNGFPVNFVPETIEGYTPTRILDTILINNATGVIETTKILQYLTTWMDESDASDEEKEQFEKDLYSSTSTRFGQWQKIEKKTENGTIKESTVLIPHAHIIAAVLTDMGILKPTSD